MISRVAKPNKKPETLDLQKKKGNSKNEMSFEVALNLIPRAIFDDEARSGCSRWNSSMEISLKLVYDIIK